MYREICEVGYTASMTDVSRFVGQLRKDSGTARSFKQVPASSIYAWTGERTRPLTALQPAPTGVLATMDGGGEQERHP